MPDAAADLWQQIFARAAAAPESTLYQPGAEDESQDAERMRTALRGAGWSPTEIVAVEVAEAIRRNLDGPTSPGVAPWLEAQLRSVAEPIKAALSLKGYREHERVLLGIDPTVGVSAGLTNVIMTDEGIVSVSSFLFRWCALVSRAYLRTLNLDTKGWSESEPNPDEDMRRLLRHPELALYWFQIFSSFALTGTHAFVSYRPSSRTERLHFEQIAWAMEFFIVGHEYAHHALGHRSVDGDRHRQEFEADSLSLFILEMLQYEPFSFVHNPYVTTGAGANLTLRALATMAAFERRLGGRRFDDDTHPPPKQRIARILTRHALQPAFHRMDLHWNATVSRIMNAVDQLTLELGEQSGDQLALLRRGIHSGSGYGGVQRGGAD